MKELEQHDDILPVAKFIPVDMFIRRQCFTFLFLFGIKRKKKEHHHYKIFIWVKVRDRSTMEL